MTPRHVRHAALLELGRQVYILYRNRSGSIVAGAVKARRIVPATSLPCADCGETAAAYDHRDYTQPLTVEAVCDQCNLRRGPAALDIRIVTQHLRSGTRFPESPQKPSQRAQTAATELGRRGGSRHTPAQIAARRRNGLRATGRPPLLCVCGAAKSAHATTRQGRIGRCDHTGCLGYRAAENRA